MQHTTTGTHPEPSDWSAGCSRKQLQEHAVLWPNQRVTDDRRNAEVDFFLALPDVGFVAVEVKGWSGHI